MKRICINLLRLICTIVGKKKMKNYGKNLRVNFPCKFTKKTSVGNNCSFNGIKIMGDGNVTIGNNFHSGKQCMIMTNNHNYEGNKLPYDDTYIVKDVVIEDNVWIGTHVIILGGAHIGEGAIIQAGSVVVGDVPALAIAGGHPAEPFKYRDEDHYYKLKRMEINNEEK